MYRVNKNSNVIIELLAMSIMQEREVIFLLIFLNANTNCVIEIFQLANITLQVPDFCIYCGIRKSFVYKYQRMNIKYLVAYD